MAVRRVGSGRSGAGAGAVAGAVPVGGGFSSSSQPERRRRQRRRRRPAVRPSAPRSEPFHRPPGQCAGQTSRASSTFRGPERTRAVPSDPSGPGWIRGPIQTRCKCSCGRDRPVKWHSEPALHVVIRCDLGSAWLPVLCSGRLRVPFGSGHFCAKSAFNHRSSPQSFGIGSEQAWEILARQAVIVSQDFYLSEKREVR